MVQMTIKKYISLVFALYTRSLQYTISLSTYYNQTFTYFAQWNELVFQRISFFGNLWFLPTWYRSVHNWHVNRWLFQGVKVYFIFFLQPADGKRESVPGPHTEHLCQNSKAKLNALFRWFFLGYNVFQSAAPEWMLPCPFKLKWQKLELNICCWQLIFYFFM